MKQQCEAICETVETLGPDRKIHHARWQCSNNGRYENDGKIYCGTHHNQILRDFKLRDESKGDCVTTDDRLHALRQSMREAMAEQIKHFKDIQFLIECGRKNERELIASWVADMCQGLDANTIAEAIRNGGNDAMDNFAVTKT